jgi:hypothetical protein
MSSAAAGRADPALLVISRGGHPGVDDALRRMVADGSLRTARHEHVRDRASAAVDAARWRRLADQVTRDHVEYVVLHHYHHGRPPMPDPRPLMQAVRALPHRPVVALTCGDAFYNGRTGAAHPPVFRAACAAADVVLNTSMGPTADAIVGYGAERVALWPNGACQVRFGSPAEPYRAATAEFDVVFIGNNNRGRNPFAGYYWYGRRRQQLVRLLADRFGRRFGVFGAGWDELPGAQGPARFDDQLAVCRRARVVVGGVPFSPARYYTSNRPFIQIASGVPFVDWRVEGIDRLLRDGEHWNLVDSAEAMADRCEELLDRPDDEREELGARAAARVADQHTQARRWRQLLKTLRTLREAILDGRPPAPPELGFLLPEVDRAAELPLATRGWDAVAAS